MKRIFLLTLLLASTVAITLPAAAQKPSTPIKTNKKAMAVRSLIMAQDYVFKAQTALPMSGPTRHLTSDYDLHVSRASIVSYLPYYGRAYVAPMDPSKNPMQFTANSFDYMAAPGKKGGWIITIKPKDHRDIQRLTLNISSEGYTTLSVTSTNQQPISYNGVIVAPAH